MKSLVPALILAGSLSACISAPRAEPCQGPMVLELRNETLREVELLESRAGSGGRVVVGIFGPGSHTVDIRTDGNYSYSTRFVRGNVASAEAAPRYGSGAVTTRRVCRA